MAGVITGKARNTDGWRLHAEDSPTIGQKKSTGMSGGHVDLSKVTDARRVSNRTQDQRRKAKAAATKAERKRASRHRNRVATEDTTIRVFCER